MPTVKTSAIVHAEPARVYKLLRDVEKFPQYTSAVDRVIPLADNRYTWSVTVAGVSYEWDVDIIENEDSLSIGWEAVTGIASSGRYQLVPQESSTALLLTIEYHLKSKWLDKTLGRLVEPVISKVSKEIVFKINQSLLTEII